MVIDFHTHCFPDRIVARAMASLVRNSGIINPYIDGSLADLRRYMKQFGIDRSVVLNIATNPAQQKNVNDFAIEANAADTIMFGSVHPAAPDAMEELYRIRENGLLGIKLHPDYQDFFVDDPAVFPIYETAAKLGLITVFHAGQDCGIFEPVHCTPERLAKALPAFGGGKVVAAHFGGYLLWYEVEEQLVGKELYFDTSYCCGRIPKGQAQRIIQNHGADKILMGSDLPWSGTENEMGFLRALGLSEKEEAAVMGGNAARLLGIS